MALMISGRLGLRREPRLMLSGGVSLAAGALFFMTRVTPTIDFWNLAWPHFLQGVSQGFIFVPLQALMLATIPMERPGNSPAAYNVAHILGGSRLVRSRQGGRGRRRGEEEEEGTRDPRLPTPAA